MAQEDLQAVVFRIGEEDFGVDIQQVSRIIRNQKATPVPKVPPHIKGVLNLGGKVLVVMDLAEKLGLAKNEDSKSSRIIIVDVDDVSVGLIVDSASEVIRLTTEQIQSPPKMISEKSYGTYIKGVGLLGERLIIIMDILGLLDIEEKETLKKAHDHTKESLEKSPDQVNSSKSKLKDAKKHFHFMTHDKRALKNVHELLEYIHELDEDTFKKYVNEEKNDFYEWINDAIGDEKLANRIKKIKSKKDVSREIMNYLLSIETTL